MKQALSRNSYSVNTEAPSRMRAENAKVTGGWQPDLRLHLYAGVGSARRRLVSHSTAMVVTAINGSALKFTADQLTK